MHDHPEYEALLLPIYRQFCKDGDTSVFIQGISKRYMTATLERLLEYGSRTARRAATHALGLVGDFTVNDQLGRRMSDEDRGVRLLAEQLIRDVWFRDGTTAQRHHLLRIQRLNSEGRAHEAVSQATMLIERAPGLAEAWNQRAVGRSIQEDHGRSHHDYHQALELNPYHFNAAVNMGHCLLELKDRHAALECFQRALKLNPNLEAVRARIALLQRALEDK
jgi:tetratricopeptide (TPR) repeat protein